MWSPSSNLLRVLAVLAAVTVVSACSERRTAERADSDLSHDLALAGQVNAQPALQDTAVAPPQPETQEPPPATPRISRTEPRRTPVPQPVSTPPSPVPATSVETTVVRPADSSMAGGAAAAAVPAPEPRLIEPGIAIALSSGMRVCTSTNKVGDKLVATVTSPVSGTGGATVPAGSRVVLEVAALATGDSPDSSTIVLQPTSIYINGTAYPVTGTVTSTTTVQRTEVANGGASDKQKVLGGAIAGAILGQIFGHSTKSTVIGAAAGAATGAVVAKAQQNVQSCLPEGAALVLTLASPVTMN
jgi:YMGG-like Gly-zipper